MQASLFAGAFRATTPAQFIFRGSITSKRGDKNFYKGRGAPSMGYFAKYGKYLIDRKKYARATFSVPNLTNFKLKPYIALHAPKRAVPRPKMIVSVNFNKKLAEERALRIVKKGELEALFSDKYKGAAAKRDYKLINDQLAAFNRSRRAHHARKIEKALVRKEKKQVVKTREAYNDLKQTWKNEIANMLAEKKNGNDIKLSKAAQGFYESRHARKFREFIQVRRAKNNKHINVVKKSVVEKAAV